MKSKILLLVILALLLLSASAKKTTAKPAIVQEADNDEPGFQIDNQEQLDDIQKETNYQEDGQQEEEEEEEEEEGSDDDQDSDAIGSSGDEDVPVIDTETEQSFHVEDMKQCQYVEIRLNKKITMIETDNIYGLQKILLTTSPIEACTSVSESECPEESFCQVHDAGNESPRIELDDLACTYDTIYLYPIGMDQTGPSVFDVKVSADENLECPDGDDAGAAGQQSDKEEEESTGGQQVDQDSSQEANPNGQLQKDSTIESDDPENTQDGSDKSEKSQDDVSSPPSNQPKIGHIIGLSLLSLVLLFLLVVCIYRCQFRKNGEGIFSPPDWCPGFIFPRQKAGSAFTPIHVDRSNELTDYEPPVL